ncbi:hypothetical protein HHI36_011442 [Cryptolaemus montrouzieri]|uniref:Peroxisomal membrane protein PEX16 n=1 Tax=Cryptolaemus montrouzieri TaxID=559131 RepID=A0ABD2MMK9_9CUCU
MQFETDRGIKYGKKLKLCLTVIEYAEVFLELSASKLWGENGRWLVIFALQVFKCLSKLLLVYRYKEPIIEYPVIPVLERKNLGQKIDNRTFSLEPEMSSLGSMSFKLKHSGRVIRKVEASPPINLRLWKPMQNEVKSDSENQENIDQALIERQLSAETLYLIKPLAHLGSAMYFGNDNWKPYIIALLFDLCSLQLYQSCQNTKSESLTQQQKFQISKRKINLFLYLIRSPFYDKYSREKINKFLNNLSNRVPLASLICSPLIQYLPFWQSNYFYMWSN